MFIVMCQYKEELPFLNSRVYSSMTDALEYCADREGNYSYTFTIYQIDVGYLVMRKVIFR